MEPIYIGPSTPTSFCTPYSPEVGRICDNPYELARLKIISDPYKQHATTCLSYMCQPISYLQYISPIRDPFWSPQATRYGIAHLKLISDPYMPMRFIYRSHVGPMYANPYRFYDMGAIWDPPEKSHIVSP